MGWKKNKKSEKKLDESTQVLFFCGIGVVSLIVVFILCEIILSFITPNIFLGDAAIEKVDKQEKIDWYHVVIPIKNKENKNVKIFLKTEIGAIVYKLRQGGGMSAVSGFYKTLQPFGETLKEFTLAPTFDKNLQVTVEVNHEKYVGLEMTEKTKIEPRVTIEKVAYAK